MTIQARSRVFDLARRLAKPSHSTLLVVAGDVGGFVRAQRNECNVAKRITEAALWPTLWTIGVKTMGQQRVQMLHPIRGRDCSITEWLSAVHVNRLHLGYPSRWWAMTLGASRSADIASSRAFRVGAGPRNRRSASIPDC